MISALVPVTRPDDRLYQPRKIVAWPVVDGDEIIIAVIIPGTHDLGMAQPLADQYAAWQLGSSYVAVNPETGWFRDGYEGGSRWWIDDPVYGRAGVMFRELAEGS